MNDMQAMGALGREAASAEKPLVSIIISTLNRAESLRITLTSLRYLRYPNFEVLVVNGPSTDDTAQVIAEFAGEITPLNCDRRNLSQSRNVGIANARGEFVAFIDDDAIPEPDWLDEIITGFNDTAIASVGGFIRDNSGVRFQAKYVVCDLFGRGQGYETLEEADCEEHPDGTRFFSLTGTNVVIRRSILEEIGGFDEVFEYFLDETDVNLRLVKLGYRSRVVPEAEIHHKFAASHLRTERNVPRSMLPIARSIAYFCVRHAVPRCGWMAAYQRLRDFERSEVRYKSHNLSEGLITSDHFVRLTYETKLGVREGIRKGVLSGPDTGHLDTYRLGLPQLGARPLRASEDRLRLCLLSQDEGKSAQGGIAKWTRAVAAGLAARGHEISIIGASEQWFDTVDFTSDGYWRHLVSKKDLSAWESVPTLGLPATLANHARTLQMEIGRVLQRRRFDMISGPIWDVEPASCIGGNVPVCLSLHTTAGLVVASNSKPDWTQNEDYFRGHVHKVIAAEKAALFKSDAILANSQAIIRDVERVYGVKEDHRFGVVPHGIEDVPEPLRQRAPRTDPEEIRILFVGRLETRKGIRELAEALERVLGEHLAATAHIVGSGYEPAQTSLAEALRDKFPQRVHLHGFATDEQLLEHYRDADIFVAPSLYESFGLIFLEAMRFSLPCVGTLVGGIPEVVTNGETGLLSPVGDVTALYQNLARLCTDREFARTLGEAGRRRYEERFTIDAMAAGLERFYLGAIERLRKTRTR